MPIEWWMNKDVVCTHDGISLHHRQEWNNALCSNRDGPRDEWSINKTAKDKYHIISLMWNLKKWYKWIIYKQIHKTNFMITKGEGGGGMNWKLTDTHFSSVAQLCPTLCDPMDCSTPGLPVHHQLPEFTQTQVHWVSDAIQPSHPLLSPSPAFNLSQHQGPFQWVSSSHQVAKVLELQLQHQSFQWIFRTDLL